jgi:hypothetical protein
VCAAVKELEILRQQAVQELERRAGRLRREHDAAMAALERRFRADAEALQVRATPIYKQVGHKHHYPVLPSGSIRVCCRFAARRACSARPSGVRRASTQGLPSCWKPSELSAAALGEAQQEGQHRPIANLPQRSSRRPLPPAASRCTLLCLHPY